MTNLTYMSPEKDLTFQMRVDETFLRDVDAWRITQWPVPSRAEAIRHLTRCGIVRYTEATMNAERRQKGKKR